MKLLGSLAWLSVLLSVGVSAAEWPFDVTTITSPDGSVSAKFVSFGATMTELWVKGKDGKARDVILGYDDNSRLLSDPDHPVFNPIVGRYANRIKNGTFSIPITKNPQPDGPNVYHIPLTGQVTLHGGTYGWDRRAWTLVSATPTSVTYKHIDLADEGFPGIVTVYATHTVSNDGKLNTKLRATATEKTPIMLTQHIYWNLAGFQNGVSTALSHVLSVDASRVIKVDGLAVPTGEFLNTAGTIFDFKTPRRIDKYWNQTVGLCNGECTGYDHGWVYDKSETDPSKPGVTLYSPDSGIKLEITTNQPVVQVYTAYWLNTPRKVVHGGPSLNYSHWAAVAIEQEGYLDAINTPEWKVDQIYYPGRDYNWESTYKFSTA